MLSYYYNVKGVDLRPPEAPTNQSRKVLKETGAKTERFRPRVNTGIFKQKVQEK